MADFNPTILGRKLFPSSQVTGDFFSGLGRSIVQAFTPAAGTPPATMAGVSIPPAGASFSQLQYKGPLLGTGPMFGVRGEQQPAPQPARQPYNYGPYAATMGLPSFDVTKTQTPFNQYSAAAPQQISSALAMPPSGQAQAPSQPAPILPTPPTEERMATATPYGNIYATFQSGNSGPRQLENLNARETAYVGRTPAQQQALIAQMRERGSALAAQRTETMRNFADSRIPEGARVNLPAPQGRYGQPLTDLFPRPAQGQGASQPTLAGTGFGAGSLSSQGGFSNSRAEERRRINALSAQAGLPRALNNQMRNVYANYFAQQGMT